MARLQMAAKGIWLFAGGLPEQTPASLQGYEFTFVDILQQAQFSRQQRRDIIQTTIARELDGWTVVTGQAQFTGIDSNDQRTFEAVDHEFLVEQPLTARYRRYGAVMLDGGCIIRQEEIDSYPIEPMVAGQVSELTTQFEGILRAAHLRYGFDPAAAPDPRTHATLD